MAKAIPLFRAVVVRINRFQDTDSTQIICRVTHAGLQGEDVHQIGSGHRLASSPLVSLRLQGTDALERLEDSYNSRLKPNEEVVIDQGSTILFTAQGIRQWDERAMYRGEPMHRPDAWSPDSLSVIPRAKRFALVFASPRPRVEQAAGSPCTSQSPVLSR